MDKQGIRINNEAYFAVVQQRLAAGDQVRIPVLGKSMLPFLREKDEVLLEVAQGKRIARGDIVLARWQKRYVLHRVVHTQKNSLWLAGDNNLLQIEKVAMTDVIAFVLEARRGGKRLNVSRVFNKKMGLLWYYLRWPRRVIVAVKRRLSLNR